MARMKLKTFDLSKTCITLDIDDYRIHVVLSDVLELAGID